MMIELLQVKLFKIAAFIQLYSFAVTDNRNSQWTSCLLYRFPFPTDLCAGMGVGNPSKYL